MIDSSLLIGLGLIGAGLALGAAAFFILTRSRGDPVEAPAAEEADPDGASPPEPAQSEVAAGAAAEAPSVPELPPVPEAVAVPAPTLPPNGEPEMPEPPASSPAPGSDPGDRLYPVVTLLRDETTGQLALRVGDRTYRTAAELSESQDRNRVEFAARDLALWLEGKTQTPRLRPEGRAPEVRSGTGTMVEEINRFLERKLSGRPVSDRALRLVEGADGSVRVYVGVQGYGLDEVPDPAIRALIREAVEEWEANR